LPLDQLELFIRQNGHLPNIPNAQEAEIGIKLGEMNSKLLQKIEELTLTLSSSRKELKLSKQKSGNDIR